MNELLQTLTDAIMSHDILTIVAASLVVVLSLVSLILGALGKKIPLLTPILEFAKNVLKALPKKNPPPPPASGEGDGVAKIVPIDTQKGAP